MAILSLPWQQPTAKNSIRPMAMRMVMRMAPPLMRRKSWSMSPTKMVRKRAESSKRLQQQCYVFPHGTCELAPPFLFRVRQCPQEMAELCLPLCATAYNQLCQSLSLHPFLIQLAIDYTKNLDHRTRDRLPCWHHALVLSEMCTTPNRTYHHPISFGN